MTEEEKDLELEEECDHEFILDTCEGGTHFFYCLHCDAEFEDDCDCPEEDEDEEETT